MTLSVNTFALLHSLYKKQFMEEDITLNRLINLLYRKYDFNINLD